MANTKKSLKAKETAAPETPVTQETPVVTPPTVEETNLGERVVDETAPEEIPVTTEQTTETTRIVPKDLAEAQDIAEAKGIDYVGRNLEQLTALINGDALNTPAKKQKKVIKTPIEQPAVNNVDPLIKAAIDKANAEIAIAKAKVAEQKEKLRKERDAAKAKNEAEKAERIAKIKADKEAKEAADKLAAEEFEKNKATLEANLATATEALAQKQQSLDTAKAEFATAKEAYDIAAKALNIKTPKAKKEGGAERQSTREKDLTKYVPGTEYEINHEGAVVKVVCKSIFTGSVSGNKFYKFKEVGTGRTIRRRAYAEEQVA